MLSIVLALASPTQEFVLPQRGPIHINRSVKIKRATYNRPSSDSTGRTGAIMIKGDNITVDFNGAILRGTPATTEPDQRKGTGIVVSGKNVTIKNLKLHGYQNGIVAFDSPGIKILDSDLSYNWKQHLLSTLEREDGSDWMSFHHNDKDEWLFGDSVRNNPPKYPAIYLSGCDRFEVRNTTIVGGQNGLLLNRCNNGLAWNNNFSFLSATGISMYRSSENRIMHNNIDWCLRGFSYGVYNRGQDSAGIIIYEQSNSNVFAYNSVTHGGDGFFLWAGQTTMDTGKGGCNDNLLYANDWSHAPTNGIEATFSRNNFVNNLIMECWHGIWGGYGFNSKVVGNVFAYNSEGIAWEHGQDNLVERNLFYRNQEDIVIWSNAAQDPNWGYAKTRDTRSRNWVIRNNIFSNAFAQTFRMHRSQDIQIDRNTIERPGRVYKLGDPSPGAVVRNLTFTNNEAEIPVAEPLLSGNRVAVDPKFKPLPPASSLNQGTIGSTSDYLRRFSSIVWNPFEDPRGAGKGGVAAAVAPYYVQPLNGGKDPFLKPGTLRGWRYMFVDEWGPYDFKRPILWPRERMMASSMSIDSSGKQTGPNESAQQVFEVLGPKGTAKAADISGATIEAWSPDGQTWRGKPEGGVVPVPSFIRVGLIPGRAGNIKLMFDYVGEETVDYRGVKTAKGKAVRFGFEKFFAPIDWTVKYFTWDPATIADPKAAMPAFADVRKTALVRTDKTDRLEWADVPGSGVPGDHFITEADGVFDIPAGAYSLNVVSDDGVRVWLDGKLLIDEWHWQGPTSFTRELTLGGTHKIRVEHYEINGYATLKVELKPKR